MLYINGEYSLEPLHPGGVWLMTWNGSAGVGWAGFWRLQSDIGTGSGRIEGEMVAGWDVLVSA